MWNLRSAEFFLFAALNSPPLCQHPPDFCLLQYLYHTYWRGEKYSVYNSHVRRWKDLVRGKVGTRVCGKNNAKKALNCREQSHLCCCLNRRKNQEIDQANTKAIQREIKMIRQGQEHFWNSMFRSRQSLQTMMLGSQRSQYERLKCNRKQTSLQSFNLWRRGKKQRVRRLCSSCLGEQGVASLLLNCENNKI